jgi:hypothetical protein
MHVLWDKGGWSIMVTMRLHEFNFHEQYCSVIVQFVKGPKHNETQAKLLDGCEN